MVPILCISIDAFIDDEFLYKIKGVNRGKMSQYSIFGYSILIAHYLPNIHQQQPLILLKYRSHKWL